MESNLTEVLLQNPQASEPLLPFNEAISDPVLTVWEKPTSAPAVSQAIARRYKPAPDDPTYLTAHLTPESLVFQASCSSRLGQGSFPTTPSDRESKKQEQTAKKIFSSGSMALKSINASCLMGRYIHALLESVQSLMPHLSDAVKSDFRELIIDGQNAAQQVIQAGLDTADSVARSMGTSVSMRR